MIDEKWTKSQKVHARELFDLALEREYAALIKQINATKITTRDEVWDLYEMLGEKRKELNGKYDYRYSQLLFVFAQLVRGGYLTLEELEPIGEAKLNQIEKMVNFKGV